MTPDDVRALREAAEGRPFTIAVGGSGRRDNWEAERAHIASVAAAGANWWIEWVPPATREMIEAVERGPLRIESEIEAAAAQRCPVFNRMLWVARLSSNRPKPFSPDGNWPASQ